MAINPHKTSISDDIAVKICGVRDADILQTLIDYQIAYAGFVFYAPSPRFINIPDAKRLRANFANKLKFVGLFVDETIENIIKTHQEVGLDAIQLHGHEPPEMLKILRKEITVPLIKAVGIAQMQDIQDSEIYWDIADHILFDAKPNPNDILPGGLGRAFSHQLLNDAQNLPSSWWLAGGLNAQNINDILAKLQHKPEIIDFSSALETKPGIKSVTKIMALIAQLNHS